jgi:hypothetical protein
MPDSESKQPRPKSLEDVGRHLDEEIEGLIRWFNDEVVPSVRQHSSRTLRSAAEKLSDFADRMDDMKRQK